MNQAATMLALELQEKEAFKFSARQIRRLHSEVETMKRDGASPDPGRPPAEFAAFCQDGLDKVRAHRAKIGWHLRVDWQMVIDVATAPAIEG